MRNTSPGRGLPAERACVALNAPVAASPRAGPRGYRRIAGRRALPIACGFVQAGNPQTCALPERGRRARARLLFFRRPFHCALARLDPPTIGSVTREEAPPWGCRQEGQRQDQRQEGSDNRRRGGHRLTRRPPVSTPPQAAQPTSGAAYGTPDVCCPANARRDFDIDVTRGCQRRRVNRAVGDRVATGNGSDRDATIVATAGKIRRQFTCPRPRPSP
jgi:hypothetical protein